MIALDLLLDTLPDALVGEEARKRLRRIGDQLPDALAEVLVLEVRLDDDPQVDVSVAAGTRRQLGVLAGTDPNVRLTPELVTDPAWRSAARLARRSLNLTGTPDPLLPVIWLEFDADPASFAPPAPATFVAAAPSPAAGSADWDLAGTVAAILATATWGDAPRLDEPVGRLRAAGIGVRMVGYFGNRPSAAARLVCGLEPVLRNAADLPGRLVAALTDCGWYGPQDAFARWVRTCANWTDTLHLSVDVTADGVLPRVGIEAKQDTHRPPRADPRWEGLLAELAAAGLCTPAKLAAVLELRGGHDGHVLYPRRYRQWLNHIKVVVAADGSAAAKAYPFAQEIGTPRPAGSNTSPPPPGSGCPGCIRTC